MNRWSARAFGLTACLCSVVAVLLASAAAAGAAPTWLPAAALTEHTGAGTLDAAMAPDGAATVAWESTSKRIEVASRTAFGGGFAPAVVLSPAGQEAMYPRVAEDGAGAATVVWMNGSVGDIEAATVTDGLPAAPVKLTPEGAASLYPSIAVNEAGAAVATWIRKDEGGEFLVEASLRPAGGSFRAPVELSPKGANAEFPRAAIDAAGESTVAWTRETSPTVVEAAMSTTGGSFSAATRLSNPAETASEPSVAMNATGDGAVAWTEGSGSDYVAQIATRSAGGAYHAPVAISAATADAEDPQVALDAAGEPTVAWINGSYVEVAEGSSAEQYSAPEPIAFSATYPSLSENEAGDAVLAWIGTTSLTAESSFRPAGASFEATRTVSPAEKKISDGSDEYPPVVSAVDAGGDGLATFELEGGTPYAALLDVAGPVLNSLSIPTTGTAGKPISFSVAPASRISSVASTTWSFGDASSESGASVSHTFADPGTYSVSVTSTDAYGNSTTATGKIVISEAAKAVSPPAKAARAFKGARLISRSVRANRRGGVRLKVRAPKSSGCQGKVALTLKVKIGKLLTAKISLGTDKFRAAADARAYVTFQLRPALLKLLREDRKLKFSAVVDSTDFRKQKASTAAKGKVTAPKARRRRKRD